MDVKSYWTKCPKHNGKCNDLMGIVLVLMETIMVSTGM